MIVIYHPALSLAELVIFSFLLTIAVKDQDTTHLSKYLFYVDLTVSSEAFSCVW